MMSHTAAAGAAISPAKRIMSTSSTRPQCCSFASGALGTLYVSSPRSLGAHTQRKDMHTAVTTHTAFDRDSALAQDALPALVRVDD